VLENRKAYETKLDAQLAQWKADIDVLKAKAKRTGVDVMVNYDKAIDAMQEKHEEASKQLRNLEASSDEAWENVKAGTEKVWLELKAEFQGHTEKV
jgi:hypothetical protein